MRIMYVEDNVINLGLVQRIARIGNHDVVAHSNGSDALKALQTDPVDLILMDIELEGEMDGIEVVKRLRARGDKRPIIAITAYAMVGDKERILEAGFDGYLPKPIPVAQFLNILAQHDPAMTGVKIKPPSLQKKDIGKAVVESKEAEKAMEVVPAVTKVSPKTDGGVKDVSGNTEDNNTDKTASPATHNVDPTTPPATTKSPQPAEADQSVVSPDKEPPKPEAADEAATTKASGDVVDVETVQPIGSSVTKEVVDRDVARMNKTTDFPTQGQASTSPTGAKDEHAETTRG